MSYAADIPSDCGGRDGCSRVTVTIGPSGYPLIVEAALRSRNSSFVIDGEAVLLGVDGVSDFNTAQPKARP
jgi:hypothetical protein